MSLPVLLNDGSNQQAGIGYSANSSLGGKVTQATSKSTAVTLNQLTGQITMNNASLASDTVVTFTVNNNLIGANDVVVINHVTTGTFGAYTFTPNTFSAGVSFAISVQNVTAGSLSEAIVLQYVVIRGQVS